MDVSVKSSQLTDIPIETSKPRELRVPHFGKLHKISLSETDVAIVFTPPIEQHIFVEGLRLEPESVMDFVRLLIKTGKKEVTTGAGTKEKLAPTLTKSTLLGDTKIATVDGALGGVIHTIAELALS